MSDASSAVKHLRERLAGTGEDRLGRALSDLLDNPLLTGTIGRAFDAREKAVQAQELAMGALNIPSAADIERLTRRLRSVSHRLEGIEDGVHRLDRALAARGMDSAQIGQRLSKIEQQLGALKAERGASRSQAPKPAGAAEAGPKARKPAKPRTAATATAKRATAKPATATAKRATATAKRATAKPATATAKPKPKPKPKARAKAKQG